MKFSWKKRPPAGTGARAGRLGYRVHRLCETGPTRSANEDAVCAFHPESDGSTLFAMVADGMGGHNAGEVASSLACEAMTRWVQQHGADADAGALLRKGLEAAHRSIREEADRAEDRRGMGTTVTAVLLRGERLHFVHVGDSRLYQLSGGDWRQLSTDHTLVGQLVRNGELRSEEADGHPMKNYLTQAVGHTAQIAPQTAPAGGLPAAAGDRWLLVSDGVYDVLSGNELGALTALPDPALALECIRALCTERRSSDNFSAVLIAAGDDLFPPLSITKEQNAAV